MQEPANEPDVRRPREAAEMLGVSIRTFWSFVHDGSGGAKLSVFYRDGRCYTSLGRLARFLIDSNGCIEPQRPRRLRNRARSSRIRKSREAL